MDILKIIILCLVIIHNSFISCLFYKNIKKKYLVIFTLILLQVFYLFASFNLSLLIMKFFNNYLKYLSYLCFSFIGIKTVVNTLKDDPKETQTNLNKIIINSYDCLFLTIPLFIEKISFLLINIALELLTLISYLVFALIRKKDCKINHQKIGLMTAVVLFIFAFQSLII